MWMEQDKWAGDHDFEACHARQNKGERMEEVWMGE